MPVSAVMQPYLVWIKLGAIVILCSALFGAGWHVNDWRWEAKESKQRQALLDQIEKERAVWEAERQRWELASQITAGHLSNLETQKDTLLATLNGLRLTRTIKVEPNVQGECESAVLDDAFRLRWNAVVDEASTGAAADRRD